MDGWMDGLVPSPKRWIVEINYDNIRSDIAFWNAFFSRAVFRPSGAYTVDRMMFRLPVATLLRLLITGVSPLQLEMSIILGSEVVVVRVGAGKEMVVRFLFTGACCSIFTVSSRVDHSRFLRFVSTARSPIPQKKGTGSSLSRLTGVAVVGVFWIGGDSIMIFVEIVCS